MSDRPLFEGELIHLTPIEPSRDAETFERWFRSTEFNRLLDTRIARQFSASFFEKNLLASSEPYSYMFGIRTLTGDTLIGFIELTEVEIPHLAAWLGIGIGDPEYQGKGYGRDAMRETLRFAFTELNLHRISLNVFSYNERAIHLYESLGFRHEGRMPGRLLRDGKRYDLVYMGLLRSEWQGA